MMVGVTFHASRFTFHVSRFTLPVSSVPRFSSPPPCAYLVSNGTRVRGIGWGEGVHEAQADPAIGASSRGRGCDRSRREDPDTE